MYPVVKKRVARLCLSLFVLMALVLCSAAPAFAAEDRKGTLTIIYSSDGTFISGANILIFQVAAISKEELPRVKYKISPDFSGCRARVDKLDKAEDVSKNALLFFEWANTHTISSNICKNATTDESGKTVFDNLDMGVYLVVQTGAQEGSRARDYEMFNAFLMDIPHEGSTWSYQVVSEPKTRPVAKTVTSLSVKKQWKDTPQEKMPESVSVQLFSDGRAYGDAVLLSEENNWSHEWSNLPEKSKWTVDEVNDLPHFNKQIIYDKDGNAVIENRYVGGGAEAGNGGEAGGTAGVPKAGGKRPKTGDSGMLDIYMSLAALALLEILFLLAKKFAGKSNS